MDENRYIVPPRLTDKYLIFRMTVLELAIVAVAVFAAVYCLVRGFPTLLLLPFALAILFIRAESGNNLFTNLLKIMTFYCSQTVYCTRGPDHAEN